MLQPMGSKRVENESTMTTDSALSIVCNKKDRDWSPSPWFFSIQKTDL